MKALRKIPGWNYFEYLLLRGFAGIINLLPITVSTAIARKVGDILYFLFPKRRKVALRNLKIAFGKDLGFHEKRIIAREAFRNLATSLMEFFRLPSMLKEAGPRFQFEGTEILDAAFQKGKGVILVISHLGSWEYLAFLPYLRHYPCSVVVRPSKNPYIYRWIQSLRRQTKLNPIDRTDAARQLLSELRKNHLTAILIDQWASGEGIWTKFFGVETSTTSIPARLAAHTKAALVPAYCLRISPGRYKIVMRPEVTFSPEESQEQVTLRLNQILENEIRRYPAQWSWAHKRWKGKEQYLALKKKGK